MLTLLHLSDLHRTNSQPRVSNDELFSALVNDSKRWQTEGIPNPDLIIVSGDLVQGSSIDCSEADEIVTNQYKEIKEFLNCLVNEFLSSDFSKIVIVPGNHDVHWRKSFESMELLNEYPEKLASNSLNPNSIFRLDYKDFKPYKIVDQNVYNSRFDHFNKFRTSIYKDLKSNPISQGDLFFQDYPELDVAIAGFSSCFGNDCFCHVGDISPNVLEVSRRNIENSSSNLAIAVWHHNIIGSPGQCDYMDQKIVHRLIDSGFNIGLHGHQHFPEATPYELRVPNLPSNSMIVISAGSLAAGNNDLPMGEKRQYNIIVVKPDNSNITIHVRAMSAAGVFTGSNRSDFGGKTYLELKLPKSTTQTRNNTDLRKLDEAIEAIAKNSFDLALKKIEPVSPDYGPEVRKIKIEALEGLGKYEELLRFLDPPQSIDEIIRMIKICLDLRQFNQAEAILERNKNMIPATILNQLKENIFTKRMIK